DRLPDTTATALHYTLSLHDALPIFHLNVACPEGYEPDQQLIKQHADRVTVMRTPEEAARGAQLLVTDVWASMGQEDEQKAREKRSEEHTSELQSRENLVCRLLLEKK